MEMTSPILLALYSAGICVETSDEVDTFVGDMICSFVEVAVEVVVVPDFGAAAFSSPTTVVRVSIMGLLGSFIAIALRIKI